jgi:hypothetical protein
MEKSRKMANNAGMAANKIAKTNLPNSRKPSLKNILRFRTYRDARSPNHTPAMRTP